MFCCYCKNRITERFAVIARTAGQNVLLLLQEPHNRMFCCYCKNRITMFYCYCRNRRTECFAVIARIAEQDVLPHAVALLFSALEILGSYLSLENGPHVFLIAFFRPTRDHMSGTPHPAIGRYTTHSPVVMWASLDSKRANDKESPK